MAAPIPLSKAHEAFRQLIDLGPKDHPIDELSLARFERAARDSLTVDPITSYQLLGMVAALRWDGESIRQYYSRAIAAGGDNVAWYNYATALRFCNRSREAAPVAERAAELAPANLSYLREAVLNRFCIGDWERALELIETLGVRTPDIGDNLRSAEHVIKFARVLGLREDTVRNSMDVTLKFLERERVRFDGISDWIDDLSDGGSIYLDVVIQTSAERAAALDAQLTALLFDGVDDLQLGVFGLTLKAA